MKAILITTSLATLISVAAITASTKPSELKASKTNVSRSHAAPALAKSLEYDFARPAIRDNYYAELDRLADAIIKADYLVSLSGHADSIGGYKYNWVLSDSRAIHVKEYLVSKGVKQERIVTTPYGFTKPIASNKTAAGRQKNRRVEISLKKANE
jgi:outer membrane protein OmpA-like peptidoglycan-associated protein